MKTDGLLGTKFQLGVPLVPTFVFHRVCPSPCGPCHLVQLADMLHGHVTKNELRNPELPHELAFIILTNILQLV